MELNTKEEKEEFIKEYMKNVTDDLLKKIDHIPEKWSGWEIKQWVHDFTEPPKMDKRRKREYNSDLMINPNLRW